MDENLVGRTLGGRFRVEACIGGGAMGSVYRARQLALGRDVALKVLHERHCRDPLFVTRFHREARAASRLDHPNSMRVIDSGQEPDGLLYIAMEYLDGRDLCTLLAEEGPLTAARIVDILSQALAALAVAHELGIVHRDLKPDNLMILRGVDDDGNPRDCVKVCDFGIATFTDAREPRGHGERHTVQGILVGTPEYMSPEQGRGEALDARSDLYATGVILYQLLTGRVPFQAGTPLGTVLKVVSEEPPLPRTIDPAIHPRLESICLKAMRKDRSERYATAREMRAELRGALASSAADADPLTPTIHADLVTLPEAELSVDWQVAAVDELLESSPPPRNPESLGSVSRTVEVPSRRGRGGRALRAAGMVVLLSSLAVVGGWEAMGRPARATSAVAPATSLTAAQPATAPMAPPVAAPEIAPSAAPEALSVASAGPPAQAPAVRPAPVVAAPPRWFHGQRAAVKVAPPVPASSAAVVASPEPAPPVPPEAAPVAVEASSASPDPFVHGPEPRSTMPVVSPDSERPAAAPPAQGDAGTQALPDGK